MKPVVQMTLLTIRNLVKSLNEDEGVSAEVYMATKLLIASSLGEMAERVFVMGVNATDGNYYSRQPHIDLWREILAAAEIL